MGSCDELASRIVALGIGRKCPARPGQYLLRSLSDERDRLSCNEFVRDGRVTQALQAKVLRLGQLGEIKIMHCNGATRCRIGDVYADSAECDEIAIATACCEALENG